VLNVITTPAANAEAVSRTLIDDPRVRRVNFTGSTRVGRKISEMAGNAMKRAVLELGGKNSLIVLADADLDYAVRAAAFSSWINGGQVCMSGDRIIVASDIAEEFADRLAERAEGLRTGDPADPETVIGPLISASAASRVAGLVDEAVKAGAKVRSGGGRAREQHDLRAERRRHLGGHPPGDEGSGGDRHRPGPHQRPDGGRRADGRLRRGRGLRLRTVRRPGRPPGVHRAAWVKQWDRSQRQFPI
jgi:hypothetical protein